LRGKNGGPKLSDTLHIRIGTWYRREIGPGMLTGMLRHGITANSPEVVRKAHSPILMSHMSSLRTTLKEYKYSLVMIEPQKMIKRTKGKKVLMLRFELKTE
jgi:hypothetical protein